MTWRLVILNGIVNAHSNKTFVGKSCENWFGCISFTYKCNGHFIGDLLNCCYNTPIRWQSNWLCTHEVSIYLIELQTFHLTNNRTKKCIHLLCYDCQMVDYIRIHSTNLWNELSLNLVEWKIYTRIVKNEQHCGVCVAAKSQAFLLGSLRTNLFIHSFIIIETSLLFSRK